MSKPGDFDRVGGTDRFEAFKADTARQVEYRKAYGELALSDPKAALAMPHPDDAGADFGEALERIRGMNVRLKADPKVEIRT